MASCYNIYNSLIQVDDIFTLVDAGGGLVDVFSYKILKIQPLLIEKLVPATGKRTLMCNYKVRFVTVNMSRWHWRLSDAQ